ncbi:MAG TPA: glycosyltransferase family 2 protein [Kofleriaceae bacterium]|jgi:hypothetical protein
MTRWLIFPMAGLSERFTRAGYTVPKYMLEAHGKTLFRHAVDGFLRYGADMRFLFIARDVADTPAFIAAECRAMGLLDHEVHVLDAPTRGQAETVALGLAGRAAPDDPAMIFNIDTFRPAWRPPEQFALDAVDGYLEVFEGEGKNWSFVAPRDPAAQTVARTTEKDPISNLCCTGLYHFRRTGDFLDAYGAAAAGGATSWSAGELYVAPLYNRLIANGRDIRYHLIRRDEVILCGTPDEYRAFLAAAPGASP